MKNNQPTTRKKKEGGERTTRGRSLWEVADAIGQPQPERQRTSTKHKTPTLQQHYPALLVFTYLARYVSRDLLMRRFPQVLINARTANYQLKALRTLKLIKRVTSQYSATFPYCYVITRQGTQLINGHFGWDLPHVREEARTPQILMHELLLTDLQVTLTLAAKQRPDLNIKFFERRYHVKANRLYFTAHAEMQSLQPDLGFLLTIKRNDSTHYLHHFLEFDRGTEAPKVFRRKLEQYDAWWQTTGRAYLTDLYERHGAKKPKPTYRLLIVSRRRKGDADFYRLATLFTQTLFLPDATRNRVFFTTGDVLQQHEYDDPPLLAPLWWQVRFSRPWLNDFKRLANTIDDKKNQKPLYDFVAQQIESMPRHSVFPPLDSQRVGP